MTFYCGHASFTSSPFAVRLSWLENVRSLPFFGKGILISKVGQTDLVVDPDIVCDKCL